MSWTGDGGERPGDVGQQPPKQRGLTDCGGGHSPSVFMCDCAEMDEMHPAPESPPGWSRPSPSDLPPRGVGSQTDPEATNPTKSCKSHSALNAQDSTAYWTEDVRRKKLKNLTLRESNDVHFTVPYALALRKFHFGVRHRSIQIPGTEVFACLILKIF